MSLHTLQESGRNVSHILGEMSVINVLNSINISYFADDRWKSSLN